MKKTILILVLVFALTALTACNAAGEKDSLVGRNDVKFGKFTWTVLDVKDDKALILTNDVVAKSVFNEKYEKIQWKDSTIRKTLNSDFLEENFTKEEQEKILETTVVTENNPWFDVDGGGETKDKIFLLSIEEMVQYFGDSGQLKNKDVSKAKAEEYNIDDKFNDKRIASADGAHVWWWLRSPGHTSKFAAAVTHSGRLEVGGYFVQSEFGVRPALWIAVSDLN